VQWEQAAELRWARQASELQSRADAWQHSVEEQNRVLNASVKQVTQVTDDVQNIYKRIADTAQLTEERAREIRRVETTIKAAQEEIGRLKQLADELLGKIDSQTKNVRQIEDAGRQRDEKVAGFQRALDFQQERLEAMASSLGQADQRQLTELSELLEAQQRVKARNEQIEQELEALRHALAEQWDKVKSALNQQRLLEEQHNARQLSELQRHLQDLRDVEAKS
jgi:chromosome segregation ATPase